MSIRNYVTVVTGMPRSGTSLMMQMLAAGGLTAVTDNRRAPDVHNPRGYFEYEPVTRMSRDTSWMADARGKAVKIIYRLLPHLPPDFEYRAVFMERDLGEVFMSQRDMLRARGNAAAGQEEDRIIAAFTAELEHTRRWLGGQPNIRTLFVAYADVISDPVGWSAQLSHFLDGLDESAMSGVVYPRLRHHWSR
ncbi:MAG: sulfotransferase [Acidobacteriota bacterium]|nr:sulfotransferase [Acidobacteriota bacterium]